MIVVAVFFSCLKMQELLELLVILGKLVVSRLEELDAIRCELIPDADFF